ncbi:MAG: hypothetical protein ACRCV9_16675 [Burkholderiaceae bacterium]
MPTKLVGLGVGDGLGLGDGEGDGLGLGDGDGLGLGEGDAVGPGEGVGLGDPPTGGGVGLLPESSPPPPHAVNASKDAAAIVQAVSLLLYNLFITFLP